MHLLFQWRFSSGSKFLKNHYKMNLHYMFNQVSQYWLIVLVQILLHIKEILNGTYKIWWLIKIWIHFSVRRYCRNFWRWATKHWVTTCLLWFGIEGHKSSDFATIQRRRQTVRIVLELFVSIAAKSIAALTKSLLISAKQRTASRTRETVLPACSFSAFYLRRAQSSFGAKWAKKAPGARWRWQIASMREARCNKTVGQIKRRCGT